MNGIVFDIKEFAVHDGPGLRTTVFFKGCPLRCKWCHNPEGLSPLPQLSYKKSTCTHCNLCLGPCNHSDCKPYGKCLHICPNNLLQIVGKEWSSNDLTSYLLKKQQIYGGGITFSGGEPTMQPDFMIACARELKSHGIHLAIETCGHTTNEIFKQVLELFDLIYLDIKLADSIHHEKYTGLPNEKIISNLKLCIDMVNQEKKDFSQIIIRTPLIPSITDSDENISAIKALIAPLSHELIPYNEMAGAKYDMLGLNYQLTI